MKILIIDDEPEIRHIASLGLNILGSMDVIEADDALGGFEKAIQEKPNVILLDVMMPNIDGPSILKRLQTHPETSFIPVIFLTALVTPSELANLKQLGAIGILTKPFDPIKLPKQIETLLEEK